MPPRLPPEPIHDLTSEERAVMLAALSAMEVARRYAGELESKSTAPERQRRRELFREATIAGRLCERLLV